jgi:hypothetical protein
MGARAWRQHPGEDREGVRTFQHSEKRGRSDVRMCETHPFPTSSLFIERGADIRTGYAPARLTGHDALTGTVLQPRITNYGVYPRKLYGRGGIVGS